MVGTAPIRLHINRVSNTVLGLMLAASVDDEQVHSN